MVANLRSAIFGLFIALLGVGVLWFQKDEGLRQFQKQSERLLIDSLHEKVNSQFNGVFFFYYGDSFVPEMSRLLDEYPTLDQVQIFGNADKEIIYDSDHPDQTGPDIQNEYNKIRDSALIEALSKNGPTVFSDNFHIRIIIPLP